MDAALLLPFKFVKAPRLHLAMPNLPRPSPMMVFTLLFLSYFMVISGIVYDLITDTPSMGSERDERTGAIRPVVFLKWRVNGQYIIEGLSAGTMFALGGLGIIALDRINKPNMDSKGRFTTAVIGIACVTVAYLVSVSFLRIKVSNYGS